MLVAGAEAKVESVYARAYTVPTDGPESDGTFAWNSTTIVVVRILAAGKQGLGYSYTTAGAIDIIQKLLAPRIQNMNVMDTGKCWMALTGAIRNLGKTGVAKMAAAAIDASLWDLKARILGLPLVSLLGASRESIPAYGSGGFTSYSDHRLAEQLSGWAEDGFRMVKMKIGTNPERDPERVRIAREAIGPEVELFVDANEAFSIKKALVMAEELARFNVTWYEQPVSHLDFSGMRFIRQHLPPQMELSSGEYGFNLNIYEQMFSAEAVDMVQADATRCGISDFLNVGSLCQAHDLPLSSHTAPALSLHLCCAVPKARNLEYFYDHARLEEILFDGVQKPKGGMLAPDLSRHGMGIELKERDAARYAV